MTSSTGGKRSFAQLEHSNWCLSRNVAVMCGYQFSTDIGAEMSEYILEQVIFILKPQHTFNESANNPKILRFFWFFMVF